MAQTPLPLLRLRLMTTNRFPRPEVPIWRGDAAGHGMTFGAHLASGAFLTQRSGVDAGSAVLAWSEERVDGLEEGLGGFYPREMTYPGQCD
jgi:hypothetical protein